MEKGEEERGNLAGVQHIILVLSGKGGVGKSTISTELALAFKHAGKKVGILDVDLCGPSIPRMLSVQDRDVHQCDSGWVPVFVDQDKSIALMSIGFLLEKPDDAVVWRGPKKNALIKQFIADVTWGELDFLIVDTPPGTSDEHISTVESLRPFKPLGAVLVTTPQAVAVGDVRRADILQENRPAHPWDCGEHERLRLSPLLGMHKSFFQRRWRRTGQTCRCPIPGLRPSGSTTYPKFGRR
uniref:NUBP iron-sulfur cluster assembly factor 2, cytosolic n=1 Tax=Naja naja TaxID=35670 RepID=A0A8C6XQD0_NAJNA